MNDIHTAPIQDGELFFEATGTGEPIFLIHAGFSDHRDWTYQIKDLCKQFRVIAYDQRGAGKSSIPTSAFWPAADLKSLMDHLTISKATLIGHSVGGTVALDFALQYPERVSSLILIASGLNGYAWSEKYQVWFQSIWNVPQADTMTKQTLSASFYSISLSNQNIKSEIEKITRENIAKMLTWKSLDVRSFAAEPISKLHALNIPALVVYGSQDSHDIKQIAQLFHNYLPNVQTKEIPNADHLLNFSNPTELNTLIVDFLSNINEV